MSWVILRNYKLEQSHLNTSFQNIIKPALVFLAYRGALSINGDLKVFDHFNERPLNKFNLYGGLLNPTLALQLYVWNHVYDKEILGVNSILSYHSLESD